MHYPGLFVVLIFTLEWVLWSQLYHHCKEDVWRYLIMLIERNCLGWQLIRRYYRDVVLVWLCWPVSVSASPQILLIIYLEEYCGQDLPSRQERLHTIFRTSFKLSYRGTVYTNSRQHVPLLGCADKKWILQSVIFGPEWHRSFCMINPR